MKTSFSNIIQSHYTSHTSQTLSFPRPFVKLSCRRLPRRVRMDSSFSTSTSSAATTTTTTVHHHHHHHRRQKDKVLVIMGATGCGKTRVSIDLATRYQSEIINCDKMQVYKGLDITTNKIPIHERLGVPHHLLGEFDPEDGELTPAEFRLTGGLAVSDIASRQKLPLVVGGSNSFVHALVVDRFNPDLDVFYGLNPVSNQLRYNCCFIWVDVSLPVLCDYLCKRVDEMLDLGMLKELSEFYNSVDSASKTELRKAIGVPELDLYFKRYPPGRGGEWDRVRRREYEEAVRMIKDNTCQLAEKQIGKIMRLKGAGWDLQRVDATESFREVMIMETPNCGKNVNNNNNNNRKNRCKKRKKKKRWMEVWERDVMEPSMKIVKRFLDETGIYRGYHLRISFGTMKRTSLVSCSYQ